jgi:hypothetical protein
VPGEDKTGKLRYYFARKQKRSLTKFRKATESARASTGRLVGNSADTDHLDNEVASKRFWLAILRAVISALQCRNQIVIYERLDRRT